MLVYSSGSADWIWHQGTILGVFFPPLTRQFKPFILIPFGMLSANNTISFRLGFTEFP